MAFKQQTTSFDPPTQTSEILALAAVFNSEFSIDWLQELVGAKASTILSALNEGVRSGWLSSKKDGVFIFEDSSVREKIWKTVPKKDQARFHQQAAEIISREMPSVEKTDQQLGEHLLHVENDLDGCRYLIEVGNRSRKEYRFEDAQKFYRKAFQDLSGMEGKEADILYSETAIQYSKISTPASDSSQVIKTIQAAIKRAKRSGLKSNLALLKMHMAKQEWLLSNHQKAFRQFNLGWSLAESIDDPVFKRSVNVFNMFFKYWQGRFKDVVIHYEEFAPAVSEMPKTEFSLLANLTIGACLGNYGQIFQGIGMMDVIRRRSREAGNLNIASHATSVLALFLVDLKRFEEAIPFYQEALEGAVAGHNSFTQVLVILGLAHAYLHIGEKKKAQEALDDYQKLSLKHQIFAAPFPLLMEICWKMEESNGFSSNGLSLDTEIQRALDSQNVYMKGMAYYYQALLHKGHGYSQDKIVDKFQQAINYLELSGHRIGLENARLELARTLIQMGEQEQAIELATPAVRHLYSLDRELVPDDFRSLIQYHDSEKGLLKEILSLGQELANIREPRDLVNRIVSTVNRIIGAERGAIFLIDDSTGQLRLRAAKNLGNEDIFADDFSESMKLIEETVKSGTEQIRHFEPSPGKMSRECSLSSIVCIPMSLRNRIIGVLYNDNRIYRNTFRSPDLETLKYFAAQAAIALDNAHAYQTLQEQYQKEKEEKQYLKEQFVEELHFEDIVGRSPAIKSVFSHIDSVASTDSAVLILGETGVGKELVARAIHNNSTRKHGPFIRVNCSALTENLVSSELFGHEKGAFTGAIDQRIGRFELADKGTLFLDEIGDISQATQLRLLRVLQTKEFERVGGRQTILSNFRLMAATNKDLHQEIKSGRFRMDLYYRLNIFPIHVPPLRERKEDIPLLAHHFLNIYTKKLNKEITSIPTEVIQKMKTYDWPGNVRELENYVERGTILSKGDCFLPPTIEFDSPVTLPVSLNISHQDNERNHILNILNQTNGRIAGSGGAAEILKLHPNTLRYRMKKLNIQINRRGTLCNS